MEQNEPNLQTTEVESAPLDSNATKDKKRCATVTLTDEPEDKDAFTPHDKIAEAIANLIRSKDPEDAKGIAIGIEGSWGSGKSTVGRLLTKHLAVDSNIAIVSFDAWAHEGDPLRRTFLETLIKKFQNLKWIDQEKWKNRRDQLANRRQVVTTKESLKITTWGKAIAFTLLLVPLGGSFIGAALRENFSFEPGPWAVKVIVLGIIGLILTFGPVLVVLLGIRKEPDLLNMLFKGATEKTTETSKTIDPTSIEFEESFEMLLEEAIAEKVERQVVLILDNLDRVDAKDALSIWSTLQTFFQHKGTGRPDWHKRLWLVVLYDLGGLSQLWQKDQTAGNNAAASFIDKSFQIRFEVPRLVPSDWGKFLDKLLKKAFPEHDEPDRHQVYRVLAISEIKQKRLPTIRELKLFVNQIGAIHRQWAGNDGAPDTFSLGHIACYVVLRRNKEDIINQLYESDFPDKDYVALLGNTLRENLAGLAFNVKTSVAQQLLYSDKIKAALMNSKPEELKQAALLLDDAFWDTFERIATTEWTGIEASKMADAALTLEQSGLLTTAVKLSAQSVIRTICEHAELVEIWSPMDQSKAKGLALLLRWKMELQSPPPQTERFVDRLFEGIAAGLSKDSQGVDLQFVAKDWLENLAIITRDLTQSSKQKALRVVFDKVATDLESTELKSHQVDPLLEVLTDLQERPEIGSSDGKNLADVVREGKIFRLFDIGNTSPTSTAWFVYLLVRYDSSLEKLKQNEHLSTPDEMIQKFVEILERFGQTALLFGIPKVEPRFNDIAVRSLALVLNKPAANQLFVGDRAVERLEFVFLELDDTQEQHETLKRLFSQLPKDLNLVENLLKESFEPELANLYLRILETSNEKWAFTEWCIAGLRAVDSDTWQQHIVEWDRLLNLALYLSKVTELNLGEQYSQGFVRALRMGTQEGGPVPPVEPEKLTRMIGPLGSSARDAFQDEVLALIKDSAELHLQFYQLVGHELVEQLNSSRDLQVLEAFELILGRKERVGLEWLDKTLRDAGPSLQQKYSGTPAWAKLQQAARRAVVAHRFRVETHAVAANIASLLNATLLKNGPIAFAAPDGSRIIALEPGSTEEPTVIQYPPQEYESVGQPTWSPDGKTVAFIATKASKQDDIFVLNEASDHIQVTRGSSSSRQPSWAPDGNSLAFTRIDGTRSNIFTIDLKTSKETQLTNLEKAEHPSWSPDGRRIVFQNRSGDGVRNILVMNPDGSGVAYTFQGSDPSWSPGGDLIAFVLRRDDASGLCVFNLNEVPPVKTIDRDDVYNPEWSPDGTRLVYQVGTDSKARIFQIDLDGQNKIELGKGTYPSWQPVVSDGPEDSKSEPTAPSS